MTEERIGFALLLKDPLFLRFALEDAPADATAEDILAICQRFSLRDVTLAAMKAPGETKSRGDWDCGDASFQVVPVGHRATLCDKKAIWKRDPLMLHRHINPKGWTLAAIDDIIGNGGLDDWLELRDAARVDPALLPDIKRITDHGAVHGEDTDAYRFWQAYVEHEMDSRSGS